MDKVALNIGAGKTYIPGFINIDMSSQADISLDLNIDKLPFEDNSVDLIISYHCIEHIKEYLFSLKEIYRVLKHGGIFLVGVPYVTLTEYNLVNPYHLNNFNEYSFDFFDQNILKGSAEEENPIAFKKMFHRFHYMGVFNLFPSPLKTWSRRHLFNVVRKIDFGLIAIKSDIPLKKMPNSKDIKHKYISYLNSRQPYKTQHRHKKHSNFSQLKNHFRKMKLWWLGNDM